ncbi:ciliary microtubule associated protein 1A-like [Halichondria panicea]|uniref:ciliary microtubule associated protein 1A-like n=1 Tax=Halichondria panicea TaxID=6063 RepID=UPI00312B6DE8
MAQQRIPKGPMIAAKERGPGPGRYKLPACCGHRGHDPTKKIMPEYSFGHRFKNSMFGKDCSPGPGYHVESAVTRFGTDGTPAYSILGRPKNARTFKTPCPGAYRPEQAHPQGEKHAPVYSMGGRSRYRKRDNNPSPNTYTLPSLLGTKIPGKTSSAAYSMTPKASVGSFSEDLAKTPGPGRYNTTRPDQCVRKAPAYSMLGRNTVPRDSTTIPGPGAHSPEKVYMNKPVPPKFSMGIRHSEYVTPLIVEVID